MSMRKKKIRTGLLFLAPILAGTALFFAIPFGMVLARSFGLPNAFGTSHYAAVLNSEAFRLAAGNTAAFLLLGVPTVLACALGIALLLYSRPPLGRLCSNTILLPLVLPLASIVLFLETLIPPRILEGPGAFWVLLGLYVWKNSGYLALLFLAGLNMIPVELYQFAALEGADHRQQLFYITLPQLKSTFGFAGVIAVINNFRCYREAFLLGGKHPAESIYLMQHFLNNNFENLNFPRLSVASVLSALPILIAAGAVAVFRRRFGDAE